MGSADARGLPLKDRFVSQLKAFWQRLRQPGPAELLAFGFILPLILLWLDPLIFKSSVSVAERPLGTPIFGRWQIFVYAGIGLLAPVLSLTIWQGSRKGKAQAHGPAWLLALLGGILLAAGLFAGWLGFLIIPFSVKGTTFAILGPVGLLPFVSAVVLFQAGRKLLADARAIDSSRILTDMALAGALLCFAIAGGAQYQVMSALDQVLAGEADGLGEGKDGALQTLHRAAFYSDIETRLPQHWAEMDDGPQRERLAQVYLELKGRPIEDDVSVNLSGQ